MVRTIISILVSLAAAALLCGSATAKDRAAEAKVYEGAVGSSSIVMSLERSDDSVSGSYFYRAKRFGIDLTGEEKNGAVQLESHLTGDKVSLKPDGSGYVGSLTTAKGKTLHVRVKAVGPDAASAAPARHRRWALSLRKYTVLTRPHEWRNGIVACADVADFIVIRIGEISPSLVVVPGSSKQRSAHPNMTSLSVFSKLRITRAEAVVNASVFSAISVGPTISSYQRRS